MPPRPISRRLLDPFRICCLCSLVQDPSLRFQVTTQIDYWIFYTVRSWFQNLGQVHGVRIGKLPGVADDKANKSYGLLI